MEKVSNLLYEQKDKQSRFMMKNGLRLTMSKKITGADAVIFKNCTLFISCISKTNDVALGDAIEFLDIVIPMHNLIEFSDNYSFTTGCLWNFYRG